MRGERREEAHSHTNIFIHCRHLISSPPCIYDSLSLGKEVEKDTEEHYVKCPCGEEGSTVGERQHTRSPIKV